MDLQLRSRGKVFYHIEKQSENQSSKCLNKHSTVQKEIFVSIREAIKIVIFNLLKRDYKIVRYI